MRYINNPITKAIVLQGLEPFDSWEEVKELLFEFRIHEACLDDIVIYTGYNKDEIADKVEFIRHMYSNIIIKYGRYIPDQDPHYDCVLGVKLASDNQYAERIALNQMTYTDFDEYGCYEDDIPEDNEDEEWE